MPKNVPPRTRCSWSANGRAIVNLSLPPAWRRPVANSARPLIGCTARSCHSTRRSVATLRWRAGRPRRPRRADKPPGPKQQRHRRRPLRGSTRIARRRRTLKGRRSPVTACAMRLQHALRKRRGARKRHVTKPSSVQRPRRLGLTVRPSSAAMPSGRPRAKRRRRCRFQTMRRAARRVARHAWHRALPQAPRRRPVAESSRSD